MKKKEPEYLLTLADPAQLPDLFRGEFLSGHREPRIAMVGRSNVGKSSLINSLLEKKLAFVSTQPGKTRAIHFFTWPKLGKIIADLPGFGFAKVSQSERNKWKTLIEGYLKADANLERILMLIDSRHGPTDLDREAIDFFIHQGIPVVFVMTKFDTLKTQSLRAQRTREVKKVFEEMNINPESMIWVSSQSGMGLHSLVQELRLKES